MLGNREHQPMTGRAEADLVANRFVKQGVAAKGIVYAGAGEFAMGITKFDIASGEVGLYHGDGDTKLEVSEAVAIGDEISAAADGKGQIAAAGEVILGHALTAGAVDTDVIEFRFNRGAGKKPAP